MLSNHDIDELVVKMGINNFKGCYYKDTLKKVEPNSSYVAECARVYYASKQTSRGEIADRRGALPSI